MTKIELLESLKDVPDNAIIRVTVIDDSGEFLEVPVSSIYKSLDTVTDTIYIDLDGEILEID
jgi:hypothetical protein